MKRPTGRCRGAYGTVAEKSAAAAEKVSVTAEKRSAVAKRGDCGGGAVNGVIDSGRGVGPLHRGPETHSLSVTTFAAKR